jgi:glutaredoxin 1|tara:strand:- start:106 stop:381 length:276 start_codon:yes stop_codon:yes gene_type:complete
MSVVIYGRDECQWCDRAHELAHQHGIEVKYKSLSDRFDGAAYRTEMFAECKTAGFTPKTVPQVFWNGKHIGGFNEFALEIENTRNFGDGPF